MRHYGHALLLDSFAALLSTPSGANIYIERCFGSPIAAADVCVSYSHAMTHSNGRADEAHLARALKLRTLSTVGAG